MPDELLPFPTDQKTKLKLQLADCLQGMKQLPSESVDVAVTSPPYNLGIAYSSYRDDLSRQQYLEWSLDWAREVKRLLKPDGALFLNIGSAPANPMLPFELAIQLRDLYVLQNTIHWIKSLTIETRDGRELSAGHFKPINSKRYLTDCHEYIFHFTKSGDVPLDRLAVGVEYSDKSNIVRWGHTGGRDRRCRGNNWFIPYKTIKNRENDRPHPATFPVKLAAQCLKLHGLRDDLVVLDPFLGIGNAALAAMECGAAEFIGFEIDPGYFNEAQSRLSSASEAA
jgi:site-specific DNA-methyltransferase (adenine-specific)